MRGAFHRFDSRLLLVACDAIIVWLAKNSSRFRRAQFTSSSSLCDIAKGAKSARKPYPSKPIGFDGSSVGKRYFLLDERSPDERNSGNDLAGAATDSAAAEGTIDAPTAVETQNPAALTTEALDAHALDVHPLDAIQAESQDSETPAPETPAASQNGTSSRNESALDSTPARNAYAPQPELNDALKSDGADDDAPRREVEGGRAYEIIYIARAGDQDATEAVTKQLRAMIEEGEGAIDNVRTSEVRRLAYPIGKQVEGVYVVVNTRFAPTHIPELDRFFKLQDPVLRHMILSD